MVESDGYNTLFLCNLELLCFSISRYAPLPRNILLRFANNTRLDPFMSKVQGLSREWPTLGKARNELRLPKTKKLTKTYKVGGELGCYASVGTCLPGSLAGQRIQGADTA